jgi:hypothetical protein
MYNKESRRTKIVTFRVSQEEYHTLEAACTAHRLRSISDLARDAVQQWIRGSGNPNGASSPSALRPSTVLDAELERVEGRIHMLTQELERLHRAVQLQRNWSATAASLVPIGGLEKP